MPKHPDIPIIPHSFEDRLQSYEWEEFKSEPKKIFSFKITNEWKSEQSLGLGCYFVFEKYDHHLELFFNISFFAWDVNLTIRSNRKGER